MADKDALSSYAELIDVIEHLPVLVRETRRRKGLSLRAAGELIGVGFNTIKRFEDGDVVHSKNLVALLRFVGGMPQRLRNQRVEEIKQAMSSFSAVPTEGGANTEGARMCEHWKPAAACPHCAKENR